MIFANQTRFSGGAAVAVALCLCLLGTVQVARPLLCIRPHPAHLTRHAFQEVSPRTARPHAPDANGLLAALVIDPHGSPPRINWSEPKWPLLLWPAHRRVFPASSDGPVPV